MMHSMLSGRPRHAAEFFRFILLALLALILLFWVASGVARAIDAAQHVPLLLPKWTFMHCNWNFDFSTEVECRTMVLPRY
ncbi:MAG TPA: hypothetical protein VND43_02405 [Burkholderiales bacterium]|nr:hypothetical protein [Burkholderiales bacterium]